MTAAVMLMVARLALAGCVDGTEATCSLAGCLRATRECIGIRWTACTCVISTCDDGNPCTADSWTGTACKHIALTGGNCDDGNACTYGDSCSAGSCIGTLISCASDQCNARACNGTSSCTVTALAGNSCTDGDACTWGEKCSAAGVCQGGTAVSCTSDQCNFRACNGTSACTVSPLTGNSCADGNACTQTDKCQAGACVGSNPVSCTPSDQCHVAGSCDPSTGVCSNPAKAPGSTCGDTANCGCSASAACVFTVDRTNYCYDKAGNATAVMVRAMGSVCAGFVCP